MKKVMIVDDELIITEGLAQLLGEHGFETIKDDSIASAVNDLSKDIIPDVILLDLYLPRKPGTELLKELRKNEKWKNIPVIILSAAGNPLEILGPYLPVSKILQKPIDISKIVDAIHEVINK